MISLYPLQSVCSYFSQTTFCLLTSFRASTQQCWSAILI